MRKNQKSKIKNKVSHLILSTLSFSFLLFTAAAFASGSAEQASSWKELAPPVINFAILVAVLVFFARKPVRDYFKKRTDMVKKSLKEAQEAKALAKKTLEEVRERLNNTDREMNEILEAAKRSGEKEKAAIIADGEKLKDKILEQAKANIEFELQKARESIKSEAALMALELAEKQIKEKLGKKEQDSLVDEYIKKLEVNN